MCNSNHLFMYSVPIVYYKNMKYDLSASALSEIKKVIWHMFDENLKAQNVQDLPRTPASTCGHSLRYQQSLPRHGLVT